MRTECQQAEVALSYLRTLVQGRLDIVHTYLDHPGSGRRRAIWAHWSTTSPASWPRARAPPGPGHLPLLLSPDTEEADLTAELDAVLGADEIGTSPTWTG